MNIILPQFLVHSRPSLRQRLARYARDDYIITAIPLAMVEHVRDLKVERLFALQEFKCYVLSGPLWVHEVLSLDESFSGAPDG
jgi:hypothetical protein